MKLVPVHMVEFQKHGCINHLYFTETAKKYIDLHQALLVFQVHLGCTVENRF